MPHDWASNWKIQHLLGLLGRARWVKMDEIQSSSSAPWKSCYTAKSNTGLIEFQFIEGCSTSHYYTSKQIASSHMSKRTTTIPGVKNPSRLYGILNKVQAGKGLDDTSRSPQKLEEKTWRTKTCDSQDTFHLGCHLRAWWQRTAVMAYHVVSTHPVALNDLETFVAFPQAFSG